MWQHEHGFIKRKWGAPEVGGLSLSSVFMKESFCYTQALDISNFFFHYSRFQRTEMLDFLVVKAPSPFPHEVVTALAPPRAAGKAFMGFYGMPVPEHTLILVMSLLYLKKLV